MRSSRGYGLRGVLAALALMHAAQVHAAQEAAPKERRQPKMNKAEKKAEKRARRAASKGEQA